MQNVLGTYSKYENDHTNSGNNMKPHRGDPISFPSPLRTQMPMKNRRIFGQCKAGAPFPAKGLPREQPAHPVAHTQLCPHLQTPVCVPFWKVMCTGSLRCCFNRGIYCFALIGKRLGSEFFSYCHYMLFIQYYVLLYATHILERGRASAYSKACAELSVRSFTLLRQMAKCHSLPKVAARQSPRSCSVYRCFRKAWLQSPSLMLVQLNTLTSLGCLL